MHEEITLTDPVHPFSGDEIADAVLRLESYDSPAGVKLEVVGDGESAYLRLTQQEAARVAAFLNRFLQTPDESSAPEDRPAKTPPPHHTPQKRR